MGAFTSRRNAGVEVVDIASNNAYRYPPKSGSYFGSHFIMGGDRFDMSQPEAYLFGENSDLNFLGNRPVPFPYSPPTASEPTKTLKSLVNIRKDSLRFIRVLDETSPEGSLSDDKDEKEVVVNTRYNIEFTFDTDVRCSITIYYFATEEISNGHIIYHPRDTTMNSETFQYKRGANQTFCQTTHIIDPTLYTEEEMQYNPEQEAIPVVIQCVVDDEEHIGHSHITYATIEKNAESGYTLKPLKQKLFVDGLCYLLQEIYGIENKSVERSKLDPDDELEDSGSECVICMSDYRDTLILPCRHLCLCNCCAESLRYQASKCPMCRAPFRALLQIRAMRKKQSAAMHPPTTPAETEENQVSQEGVPPGYEAVSLIEALNGPSGVSSPPVLSTTQQTDGLPQAVRMSDSTQTPSEKKRSVKRRKSSSNNSIKENPTAEVAARKDIQIAEEGTVLVDGRGTPEVIMSDQMPDPVKTSSSSPIKPSLPKVRYPRTKAVLTKESPLAKSPEVDAEVASDPEEAAAAGNVADETVIAMDIEDMDPEQAEFLRLYEQTEHDSDFKQFTPGDIADDEQESSGPDEPEPDYDDLEENRKHQHVLYDEASSESRSDRESASYVLQVMDPLSLPGTPASSTEASSFSSTNSSRVLLPQAPATDEDRNVL